MPLPSICRIQAEFRVAITAAAQLSDRFGFTLILATLVHATIILGVRFGAEDNEYRAPQLEVSLAQYKSEAPEEAQHLAQWDQLGSGTATEAPEMTSTEQALFKANEVQKVEVLAAPPEPQPERSRSIMVQTITDTDRETSDVEVEKDPRPDRPWEQLPEISQRSAHIASLEAKLAEQNQALAKLPRVHRITSLSTKRAVDADYVHRWREKVEAIGNRNYPQQSRRQGIYGDLRLLVAINRDGSLENVEILASSGHDVLDSAAIRIVRLAAPYPAFPPELRDTADLLEIIRTWQFRQNRLSSK